MITLDSDLVCSVTQNLLYFPPSYGLHYWTVNAPHQRVVPGTCGSPHLPLPVVTIWNCAQFERFKDVSFKLRTMLQTYEMQISGRYTFSIFILALHTSLKHEGQIRSAWRFKLYINVYFCLCQMEDVFRTAPCHRQSLIHRLLMHTVRPNILLLLQSCTEAEGCWFLALTMWHHCHDHGAHSGWYKATVWKYRSSSVKISIHHSPPKHSVCALVVWFVRAMVVLHDCFMQLLPVICIIS